MTVAEWIGALANVTVAIAAAAALYIGWRQVSISREISAIEAYEDYHKLCIDYPEFSEGADFGSLSELDRKRYLSFLLFVMMTGERVFSLFPKSDAWKEALEDDFRIHRSLLNNPVFKTYRDQQWLTKDLLEGVLAEIDAPIASSK